MNFEAQKPKNNQHKYKECSESNLCMYYSSKLKVMMIEALQTLIIQDICFCELLLNIICFRI